MLVRVGLVIGVLVVGSCIGWAQPAPTGPELRVSGNRPVLGIDHEPAVAADSSGNFVATWMSVTDEAGFNVRARRFDATGAPLGLDFQVNATSEGPHRLPDVATDAAGNFVVVWQGPDGDNSGVFARRYDSTGAPQSGEMQINTLTAGYQGRPQVARAPAGAFMVVWDDGGNASSIRARRYDAAGVPRDQTSRSTAIRPSSRRFPASPPVPPATSSSCGRATRRTAPMPVSSASATTPRAFRRVASSRSTPTPRTRRLPRASRWAPSAHS